MEFKEKKYDFIPPFSLLRRVLALGFLGLCALIGGHLIYTFPYFVVFLSLYVVAYMLVIMWILIPLAVIQHSWGEKRHGVFSHLKQISSSQIKERE